MRSLLTAILLSICFFAHAQELGYWSAGSYSQEENAQREARRISNAINVKIIVQLTVSEAGIRHRVLVAASQPDLRETLEELGIKGVWWVLLETTTSSVTNDSLPAQTSDIEPDFEELIARDEAFLEGEGETRSAKNSSHPSEPIQHLGRHGQIAWGVVGSFAMLKKAEELQQQLASTFDQILIKEVRIGGDIRYRVLIGPVENIVGEEQLRLAVSTAGLPALWFLRGEIKKPNEFPVVAIAGGVRRESSVSIFPSQPQSEDTGDGTYNPAELTADRGAFFLTSF